MTAVAAQSMAWQQRRRNHPGPLGTDGATNNGGSGEQPSGLPQVELYLGGWVDVSALGLVRHQQGIHITRGQPDENQRTNPATAAFRLANLDGRFNPRNPVGPYYGLIDKNTPCRISVQSGNSKSYRFYGEVSSWPQDWDKTGNDAWVDVQAAGILRRLSAGNPPVRSAMYMYWVYALGSNPYNQGLPAIAYWPCEDATGATSFASGVGGAPMTYTGSPTLASNTTFVISSALPVLNGSVWRALVPTYTPGVPTASVGISSSELQVEFLLAVPSSGDTTGSVVASVNTSGSVALWEVVYTNSGGGTLAIRAKDSNGNILATSAANTIAVNGVPVVAAIVLDQFGTAANGSIRLSAAANPGTTVYAGTGNIASTTFGLAKNVTINPSGALTTSAVGHVSVSTGDDAGQSANSGFPGENAAARIQRLCGYLGIPFELVGPTYRDNNGFLATSVAMGQQDAGTFLDLIQECVDADGGVLFELTDQIGIGYRTRTSLENQSPVLALDYSQAQLVDIPKPVDDDTFTRNDITVTRLNGSSARAFQATGPLNFQTPPAGVGRVETSVTLNVQTDSQAADEAGWRLHLGTVNEARYPGIGVELSRAAVTGSTTLRPQILGVNPGDRITVANPPAFALAVDTISALAIGWNETFNQFTHHIAWNTRPESPFRVATTDDPVFGYADTDGSTLAQPIGAPLTGNPFFSGGNLTGWTGFQASIAASQAIPGGPFAWSCLYTSNGTAGGALEGSPAPFAVSAGTVAQTSCWVYSPTGGNVAVGVDWQDVNHNYLSTSVTTVAVPAGVWTAVGSGALTAPASTAFAYPRCGPTPAANGLQLYVQGLLSWLGAVQVATTNSGSPLWTTSTADFPFDVSVGGERMTVTGVTGSSSPQAFTVTRAANSVVKPQSQGASVQLWQPAILSM